MARKKLARWNDALREAGFDPNKIQESYDESLLLEKFALLARELGRVPLGLHMHEAWTHQLETWHEFFILLGTAGLTLTGLLFVVISLGPRVAADRHAAGVRAFVSPNAVYFTSALVVSALFLVPGLPATLIGVLLCVGACASLVYLLYTRAHQLWRSGKLPLLDWIWFVGLPPLSYLLLFCAGVGFLVEMSFALYGVATSLVLLVIIGIRNAWDLVLWTAQKQHTK